MILLKGLQILFAHFQIFRPSNGPTKAKGHSISKYLFGVLNSSKNQAKQFDLTILRVIPQVELFSFVFWKNSKHQKGLTFYLMQEKKING